MVNGFVVDDSRCAKGQTNEGRREEARGMECALCMNSVLVSSWVTWLSTRIRAVEVAACRYHHVYPTN